MDLSNSKINYWTILLKWGWSFLLKLNNEKEWILINYKQKGRREIFKFFFRTVQVALVYIRLPHHQSSVSNNSNQKCAFNVSSMATQRSKFKWSFSPFAPYSVWSLAAVFMSFGGCVFILFTWRRTTTNSDDKPAFNRKMKKKTQNLKIHYKLPLP